VSQSDLHTTAVVDWVAALGASVLQGMLCLAADGGMLDHSQLRRCSWRTRGIKWRLPCRAVYGPAATAIDTAFSVRLPGAGFVTSGLDLWKGHPCAQRYFRQRIWGSMSMTQSFITDTKARRSRPAHNSERGWHRCVVCWHPSSLLSAPERPGADQRTSRRSGCALAVPPDR
jgi:hypothetical protein